MDATIAAIAAVFSSGDDGLFCLHSFTFVEMVSWSMPGKSLDSAAKWSSFFPVPLLHFLMMAVAFATGSTSVGSGSGGATVAGGFSLGLALAGFFPLGFFGGEGWLAGVLAGVILSSVVNRVSSSSNRERIPA